MGLYSLGIPHGRFAGGIYGAWATQHYGWRMAFFPLGIPGVLLAVLLPLLVREPVRGRLDVQTNAATPSISLGASIGVFLRSATLVLVALGCSLSAVVGYSLMTWSPAFLMRVQGATLQDVGTFYSPMTGLSVAIGIVGSGNIVDRLGASNPRAYPLVPAAAFALAIPMYRQIRKPRNPVGRTKSNDPTGSS